jgi:tetrachloro-p-hydroquinone reductive dehalogenase
MRLYHARPSYYSMIARLALVENGRSFESVLLDIHRRAMQLEASYVRLNPNMTVPTLVVGDRVLADSRDILLFAFARTNETLDGETARWVAKQYAFPIEELTFGSMLSWNPVARSVIPGLLAKTEARLHHLANLHPDLTEAYERRAGVFAARRRAFDPSAARSLFDERRSGALALLDELEDALADGRTTLVPGGYGPADVVWTVFLARLHWVDLGPEIARRPSLRGYCDAMFARPSFEQADVWRSLKLVPMLEQVLLATGRPSAPPRISPERAVM